MSRSALLIAGTHSGCGKTTVTLGVMAALARRGLTVSPFKCGPDFIDPSLHRMVTGRVSRNLDVRMCGVDWVRHTFARHSPAQGIAVAEGVMGLFDGGEGSAATLAKTLDLPVLLVVDVRSAAESVAAVVHGFATLDPAVRLAGRRPPIRKTLAPVSGILARVSGIAAPCRKPRSRSRKPQVLVFWTHSACRRDRRFGLFVSRAGKIDPGVGLFE